MVTAGANQAFTNAVLALVDAGDSVVLFAPYYFNHAMAVQMTGGARQLRVGPCSEHTLCPDLDWLEAQLAGQEAEEGKQGEAQGRSRIKMVVMVNPCNPTGKRGGLHYHSNHMSEGCTVEMHVEGGGVQLARAHCYTEHVASKQAPNAS